MWIGAQIFAEMNKKFLFFPASCSKNNASFSSDQSVKCRAPRANAILIASRYVAARLHEAIRGRKSDEARMQNSNEFVPNHTTIKTAARDI
ncbi:hypothetical protein WR25_19923 [Diploscapter pachys]|uniref:Uncharacterized protein n=1 Tax=Diploscapter pachys TaxID=2018661 RepID=A0A2A2LXK6_9BILA|nr:hypothetical protein WR25_19923 [Diploscapter pachys]